MSATRGSDPRCPCCGGSIERFPDPDGSCDSYCRICTWHEHRPTDDEITQARREQKEARERRHG